MPVTPQERWERHRRHPRTERQLGTYDDVLALVMRPEMSLRQVARHIGVSESYMNVLYHRFFRDEVDRLKGRQTLRMRLEDAYLRRMGRRRKDVPVVPYERVLGLFEDPTLTLREISEFLSLNLSDTGKIFKRYFEPLVGMDGFAREGARSKIHQQERRNRFRGLPELGVIVAAARDAGLAAERLQRKGGHGYLAHKCALRIESYRCLVHIRHMLRYQPTGKHLGRHFVLLRANDRSLEQWDAHIVYVKTDEKKPGRTFVIPNHVLRRYRRPSGSAEIWIKVVDSGTRRQKVDWFKYENAWHLLEGE